MSTTLKPSEKPLTRKPKSLTPDKELCFHMPTGPAETPLDNLLLLEVGQTFEHQSKTKTASLRVPVLSHRQAVPIRDEDEKPPFGGGAKIELREYSFVDGTWTRTK